MMCKDAELPVETVMANIVQLQQNLGHFLDQTGMTFVGTTTSHDLRRMMSQLGVWYDALRESNQLARNIMLQQRTAKPRTSARRKA